jgi:hypothetical protein
MTSKREVFPKYATNSAINWEDAERRENLLPPSHLNAFRFLIF